MKALFVFVFSTFFLTSFSPSGGCGCTEELIKEFVVDTVIGPYRDTELFSAPLIGETSSDWKKIWSGEVKSNYTFTYIKNPYGVITNKEDLETLSYAFEYDEPKESMVAVKIKFFISKIGKRFYLYSPYDLDHPSCGYYDLSSFLSAE